MPAVLAVVAGCSSGGTSSGSAAAGAPSSSASGGTPVAGGLTHVRRGVVVGVDEEARQVNINWLPDAEATVPVDDLDP